jgi:hypothetical protein
MFRAEGLQRLGLALALPVLVLAAGCDQAPPEDPAADDGADAHPVDAAGDLLELDAECRSQEQGYVVAHPQPWHVNAGEHLPPCSVFDPDPVQLEDDRELPADLAVTMVEVEATGEGLRTAGLVTYRYYVDWGSDTLIAETHDVADAELAFEDRRDLLDAMMDNLEPLPDA